MSNALPEGQAQPQTQPDPSAIQAPTAPTTPDPSAAPQLADPGAQQQSMARFTIHIPLYDQDKKEIPHVLGATRRAMTMAGFDGRIVVSPAQGDWKDYDTEDMALVMTDAPDDPTTLQSLMTIAQGVKALTNQPAVYITKQPIETFLI